MIVAWLSLWLISEKLTFARNIANRRLGFDSTTELQLEELYANPNILRDLTLTTESVWEFEEVNYDDAGGLINEEHNDCYGINIACTLAMGHIRPVCGTQDDNNNYEERFISMCEMDYRNCIFRVEKGRGVFGTGVDNDYLDWQDEGYNCQYLDNYRKPGK